MITETGRVIAQDGRKIWIQTIRQSACQSCAARQGCGQRVLASASGGKANQVLVENTLDARVGDEVTVAIDESALLGASMLIYALPLMLFVVAALGGHWLAPESEGVAILLALAGLAAGFGLARGLQHRREDGYAPQLLRINAAAVETMHPTDS
ncbi:SoxR reducing system RseC family protein [Marinobacter sp. SS21]|uniref:SoxR reducing system RseC family protein n=1 Tax=Marinobacter sp. SS21 TaxID=2979460 RepID=UPI00233071D8|nr:SoxR reducing system RseC family protein [Marinobacter sp. SS21]MDC0662625.1 SoxR reducing system RseC family protein [Marinobacter sp. SS21]